MIVMAAKLAPEVSDAVLVHVSTLPATGVPQLQPPDVVPAAIDGLVRSAGKLTATVVVPEMVEVPTLATVKDRLAALPASHDCGELDAVTDRSAPLTTTMFALAESLSEFGSAAFVTVAVNGASWVVPEAAPVTDRVTPG